VGESAASDDTEEPLPPALFHLRRSHAITISLSGVRLAISDVHRGVVGAIGAALPGT
jgi:hypothetical protein